MNTRELTLTARSTPYRETRPGTYTCERCGIQRKVNKTGKRGICKDCRDDAINLGWIEPTPTYVCAHCQRTIQGTGRDMCGMCTWNTRNRATA